MKQTRWILVGVALAGLVTDSRALDPNRTPSQYVHEQWTTETGFPGGVVNSIAQTADGYLWIGTDKGLLRFDGFDFKPVSLTSVTTTSNISILQVLTDAGGKLWIRPQGADLILEKEGKFERVRYGPVAITAISKDNHDGVLVSDIRQGTFRFGANGVQKLGPNSPPVISLSETTDGNILLGTLGDGLFSLTDGRASNVNAGLPDRKINSLLLIGKELWVGTDTGLFRGNGKDFHRVQLPSFLGSVQVLSILRDHESNLWLGTTHGLLRMNEKGFSFFEENDLRGDGGINTLFEDREGNLWIGGAHGLGRIRDSAFVTYSSVSDRRFEHNGPVYVDPEGRTWVAPAQGGLYVLENGGVRRATSIPANEVVYSIAGRADEVWVGRQHGGLTRLQFRNGAIASRSYTQADGLAQNSVYAVYESRDGSVWAGTLSGGVSKLKAGRFTTHTTGDGVASNSISSILETRDGAMWFATPGGLSSFSNGQWKTYKTAEGLPSPEVSCLFEDSSGTLWSGTSAGLAFFTSGHFQVLHESPEVLHDKILGVAEDKSRRFWIATSDRVLRVPRDKLLSGVVEPVDVREYDQADGLKSTEGVNRSQSVVSDSAGRIWFSLRSGLSVVDSSQVADDSVPALPHIEAITADNITASLGASIRIPPSPRRITFEYTGLSLAVPGRIRFRYFLEGFDRDWSRPVGAREAVYTNLGPGSYRFRLVASNSDGLWNGPESVITLNVTPAFYQTAWFRALGLFLFLAVFVGVYRLRLRNLERQRDALRKSEKELRDVIDTIPATVWSALPDGSNTYVNKHFVEYSGVTAKQTVGAGWKTVIHPDDLPRHVEKWKESVASGKPHENEVRFRRSDGQYRWHLDRGVPLRDKDGRIVKWYGVVTDIEDRKCAEKALALVSSDLQESKAKLEEAQRITHVGYWEWDILTDRVHWSDEAYRIYGMQPQEQVMYLPTVAEKIHPEDWKRAMEAALGGGHFTVECRLFRPTGEMRIAQYEGDVKKDATGKPCRIFGTIQDITERKCAEQRLRESEAYLAEAQRLSQTGSWAWNPTKGDIRYWSEMCFSLLGFDPAGPLPRFEEFVHRIHPDDQAVLMERFDQAIHDKTDFDLDYRVVHPEKGIRDIHVVGHAVLDGSGNLDEFVGTVIDVTERKRAEEALHKSQLYLSEGQRLAHMGSWAFNPSGFFEYWSQELFEIYGLDPQKGAPTLEQYLAIVHPLDRDFMASTIKKMHVERTGCDVKKRIVRPDGVQRYIRCVGISVIDGEALKGFLGTAIDITEQELLTQELQRERTYLTDSQSIARIGGWAYNLVTHKLLHSSDANARLYGFDPSQGPIPTERYFEAILAEDEPHVTATLDDAARTGADVYLPEYRIRHADGSIRFLRAIGHRNASGEPGEYIGVTMDITELKSAEHEREKLRELEADLAHIDRVSTLGEMAASLAHEIKQPIAAAITSANSCIEWLSHEPPNLDRARAAAARIDKYGNRAAEIIDRIRSFYKKSPPQRELLDVNGIIHEMFTLLKGEAQRFSVAMRTDLSAEAPKITADRVQMQQVFMNLMLNAIEAMERSGGELTVKSTLCDGQLRFSVSDTGVGLPTEKMDQIFSAFFTTKPQGSGMGLAISRSIVESHGGQLWATANGERGATFHFTLPTHSAETTSQSNLATLE